MSIYDQSVSPSSEDITKHITAATGVPLVSNLLHLCYIIMCVGRSHRHFDDKKKSICHRSTFLADKTTRTKKSTDHV